jgi:hypothetical protein
MLVNFASFALFTNRLVVKLSLVLVMFLSLSNVAGSAPHDLGTSDTTRGHNAETILTLKHSDRELRARHLNVIIRHIGHRLLLQSGDFTSRVLPVIESTAGTFQLRFENNFVFSHDSLMVLSQSLLPETQFPSGYTVTVHDCVKGDIVYGFQLNNTSPDLLACRGRSQPSGCYVIEFTFPDFYENVVENRAEIIPLTEELKSTGVGLQETNLKVEEAKERKSANAPSQELNAKLDEIKELPSLKVDRQKTNPIPAALGTEQLKTTTSGYPLINVLFIGMLLLLGVTLLIGRNGTSLDPTPPSHSRHPGGPQNQSDTAIKEPVRELVALGKFLFDVKYQRLLLDGQAISLTDKECKILQLLNKSFGELTARETLMQEVWINEGVITGRSLDMFVSKLRKKLSSDPDLRITNIHGKGYALEVIS